MAVFTQLAISQDIMSEGVEVSGSYVAWSANTTLDAEEMESILEKACQEQDSISALGLLAVVDRFALDDESTDDKEPPATIPQNLSDASFTSILDAQRLREIKRDIHTEVRIPDFCVLLLRRDGLLLEKPIVVFIIELKPYNEGDDSCQKISEAYPQLLTQARFALDYYRHQNVVSGIVACGQFWRMWEFRCTDLAPLPDHALGENYNGDYQETPIQQRKHDLVADPAAKKNNTSKMRGKEEKKQSEDSGEAMMSEKAKSKRRAMEPEQGPSYPCAGEDVRRRSKRKRTAVVRS
ncbi:hypothetical protein OBBRIDRAFT_835827 [Obba rivulosa]|uniref:Uncharacterized protein n=1 Tax=Obba rivulosa TaxID=1052685 RepID=A0A8E2DL21_9APHY|nr:hypothetical protein OBBRIDRAFT_835827 [Obba rivulosa]